MCKKSFLSENKRLMSEWHSEKNLDLNPCKITYASHKKVWWKCSQCGHEYETQVVSRSKGSGCPKCANIKRLEGFRKTLIQKRGSLSMNNPELAAEWHPTKNGDLTPSMVTTGSHIEVWWLGKCGHEWKNPVNRRNEGYKCPYCSDR